MCMRIKFFNVPHKREVIARDAFTGFKMSIYLQVVIFTCGRSVHSRIKMQSAFAFETCLKVHLPIALSPKYQWCCQQLTQNQKYSKRLGNNSAEKQKETERQVHQKAVFLNGLKEENISQLSGGNK